MNIICENRREAEFLQAASGYEEVPEHIGASRGVVGTEGVGINCETLDPFFKGRNRAFLRLPSCWSSPKCIYRGLIPTVQLNAVQQY